MLEPHVVTRIRETIAAQIEPRQRTLLSALERDETLMNGRGLLGSPAATNKYTATAADELKIRARIVWAAIQRSHSSLVGQYVDATPQDLRDELHEQISAQATRVCDTTIERMKNHQPDDGSIRSALNLLASELQREAEIEAQFYLDALRRPAGQVGGTAPVINIHGSVGAVQTGTYAVAHISLSAQDLDHLLEALRRFHHELSQNTEIGAEQREQGTELVADVITAVTAEKPNAPKISGLLGGLATTVQTVASLRGAWEFLRDAAIAAGLLGP